MGHLRERERERSGHTVMSLVCCVTCHGIWFNVFFPKYFILHPHKQKGISTVKW